MTFPDACAIIIRITDTEECVLDNNTYLYTGNPIEPKYNLNLGDMVLESGKDFDLEITDNVNVGTAHVKIIGKGKFKGELERTFEILPVPARSLSFFADNTEFDYTGRPCVMKVAVRFGDVSLVEGRDYKVEYSNNVKPGVAQATLTFSGNFSGKMTIPFTIFEGKMKPVDLPKEPAAKEKAVSTAEKPKAQAASAPKTDKPLPPAKAPGELENVSVISGSAVNLGESVNIHSAARGGEAPYTFAVVYKKSTSNDWRIAQRRGTETELTMTPDEAAEYLIMIKAMDKNGVMANKTFKLLVNDPASED